MTLSQEKAQTMAGDLARLVKNLMHAEQDTVALLAIDRSIGAGLEKLRQGDPEAKKEASQAVFEILRAKFQTINAS